MAATHYHDYAGSGDYLKKPKKKLWRAFRRIAVLKHLVRGRAFLEVGCNVGYAVEAARREGFVATGIDLDTVAIATAREQWPECRFESLTSDALALEGKQYNLIFCTEVIEHIQDIHGFAESLKTLLADGGVLFVTTPDAGHRAVPGDFIKWNETKPPQHCCYFDRKSLTRLLGEHGMSPVFVLWGPKPNLRGAWRRNSSVT